MTNKIGNITLAGTITGSVLITTITNNPLVGGLMGGTVGFFVGALIENAPRR